MASSSATHTGVRFARATSCGGRSCRCYGGPDCRRSGSMTSDILRRHYCWPRAFIARSSRNASGVRRSRSPSTPTATSCRGRARGRLQARCAADANCGTIAAHCDQLILSGQPRYRHAQWCAHGFWALPRSRCLGRDGFESRFPLRTNQTKARGDSTPSDWPTPQANLKLTNEF